MKHDRHDAAVLKAVAEEHQGKEEERKAQGAAHKEKRAKERERKARAFIERRRAPRGNDVY